jgi:hypothetical protein
MRKKRNNIFLFFLFIDCFVFLFIYDFGLFCCAMLKIVFLKIKNIILIYFLAKNILKTTIITISNIT